MLYLYCFYYWQYAFIHFYFIPFVYFSVYCTLCIFVFYNHCCLVRINKWMDGWIASMYPCAYGTFTAEAEIVRSANGSTEM